MSERIKGFVVTLNNDYKEEDLKDIKNAIFMTKGILSIESIPANIDDYMNRERIKNELKNKIWEALK
jgi:hypothetical protein